MHSVNALLSADKKNIYWLLQISCLVIIELNKKKLKKTLETAGKYCYFF